MKKRFLFSLMFVMLGLFLVACTKDQVKHTVTFNSNGGSEVVSKEVDDNALVARPTDPTKADHSFDGWFKESALTNEWKFAEDKVTGDITLYAKWTENTDGVVEKVKVTFNLNYGGAPQPSVVEVNKGSKVTPITEPTRAEFKFIGWSTSASENKPFNFDGIVNANTTLYAVWETTLETVVVTFDPDNGEDTHTVNAVVGRLLSDLDEPVKANHIFLGWFNGEVKWNFETDLVEVEMTLKAKWQLITRDGTPISTPEELIAIMTGKIGGEEVYYLTQDIDMEGVTVEHNTSAEFSGLFDGEGYSIKNLTYHGSGRMGLFRTIKGGSVINLVIENADIKSTADRAGIIGAEVTKDGNRSSDFKNITIIDSVIEGNNKDNSAGGLVGYLNAPSNIENISISGTDVISKNVAAGGLIGRLSADGVNIKDVYVEANITSELRAGGLIGVLHSGAHNLLIENAVAYTTIKANDFLGSFIGKGDNANTNITIKNSVGVAHFADGSKVDKGHFGPIVGDPIRDIVLDNVYASVNGYAITDDNGLSGKHLVTNALDLQKDTWWTENLPTIVASELWRKSANNHYVIGDVDYVAPEYVVVTYVDGDKSTLYSANKGTKAVNIILGKDGFYFNGWFTEDVEFDFSQTIEAPVTLTASWTKIVIGEFVFDKYGISTDGSKLNFEFKFMNGEEVVDLSSTNIEEAFFVDKEVEKPISITENTSLVLSVFGNQGLYRFIDKEGTVLEATVRFNDLIVTNKIVRTEKEAGKLIDGNDNYYTEYTLDFTIPEAKAESTIYVLQEVDSKLVWADGKDLVIDGMFYQDALASTGTYYVFVDNAEGIFLMELEHTKYHVVTINYLEIEEVQLVLDGEKVILPENTDDLFFKAWYTDAQFEFEFDPLTAVKAELDLYADVHVGARILVSLNWEGLEEEVQILVDEEGKINLNEIVREGFSFVAAFYDEEMTLAFDENAVITEAISLWIEWEEVKLESISNILVGIESETDYFTTSGSIQKDMPVVIYDGFEITQPLKFDSKGFFEFTTTGKATITIVAREIKDEHLGKGIIKYSINGVETEIRYPDNGGLHVVLEADLDVIGTYKFSQSKNGQAIYYVKVTETFE